MKHELGLGTPDSAPIPPRHRREACEDLIVDLLSFIWEHNGFADSEDPLRGPHFDFKGPDGHRFFGDYFELRADGARVIMTRQGDGMRYRVEVTSGRWMSHVRCVGPANGTPMNPDTFGALRGGQAITQPLTQPAPAI